MSERVQFSLLGPVRAWSGDHEIALGSPQQKSVLALLLLRNGVVVSMDHLVDGLWDGEPPRTARQTVRTYVFRLRRVLAQPDGSSMIQTVGDGYVVRAEPEALDLSVFRTYLSQVEIAGDPEQARDVLRAALALWKGDALTGLPGEYLHGQRAGLARLRLDVREHRLRLEMQLGDGRSVIGELTALVEENPLDERFRRLLMLVLYRTGQQAQALAVYRDAQVVLAEELGVDPGPLLQDLHLRILRAEPVEANGLAAPLVDLPDIVDRAVPDGFRSNQLPPDTIGFSGRFAELSRLTAMLGRRDTTPTGIVCIQGMAGVGKTTLAVHWAHQVSDRFPDGLVYLNLRGFDPSPSAVIVDEAMRMLLAMLGVQQVPSGSADRTRLYRQVVTGRRILILLDNARDAEQVRALLPGIPGVFVVVTSRVQLTSLTVREQAQTLRMEVMDEDQARALFLSRLGGSRADVDATTIGQIVAFCGGLPLALMLVAARGELTPTLPLAARLSIAGDALDVLSDPDLTIDLRTVFSWSYRCLEPEAARLFRLMSVHPGPDLAVEVAVNLADRSLGTIRGALAELVAANLVQPVEPGRYALHDLLRAYAGELSAIEDEDSVRLAALTRMVEYYLHRAQIVTAPADEAARQWVLRERRVLVGVIQLAAAAGLDHEIGLLAAGLSDDINRLGFSSDQISLQLAALEAGRRLGDRRQEAHAHRRLGSAHLQLLERQPASEHLDQAFDLFQELGDLSGQSRVLRIRSTLETTFGDYEAALVSARQAQELAVVGGDDLGRAGAWHNWGWSLAHLGHEIEALEYCRRSQREFKRLGAPYREACAWVSLGFIHERLGASDEARGCCHRAVTLFHEIGDRLSEADTLVRIGDSHLGSGDPAAASAAWAEALRLFQALGHPRAESVRAKVIPVQGSSDRMVSRW
jgi:DNA-binding SARP family transcriptional activator/tetratricopeptide (TPR) repeat protein